MCCCFLWGGAEEWFQGTTVRARRTDVGSLEPHVTDRLRLCVWIYACRFWGEKVEMAVRVYMYV